MGEGWLIAVTQDYFTETFHDMRKTCHGDSQRIRNFDLFLLFLKPELFHFVNDFFGMCQKFHSFRR